MCRKAELCKGFHNIGAVFVYEDRMKTDDKNTTEVSLTMRTLSGLELFTVMIENNDGEGISISETELQIIISVNETGSQASITVSKEDLSVFIEKLMFIYPRLSKP